MMEDHYNIFVSTRYINETYNDNELWLSIRKRCSGNLYYQNDKFQPKILYSKLISIKEDDITQLKNYIRQELNFKIRNGHPIVNKSLEEVQNAIKKSIEILSKNNELNNDNKVGSNNLLNNQIEMNNIQDDPNFMYRRRYAKIIINLNKKFWDIKTYKAVNKLSDESEENFNIIYFIHIFKIFEPKEYHKKIFEDQPPIGTSFEIYEDYITNHIKSDNHNKIREEIKEIANYKEIYNLEGKQFIFDKDIIDAIRKICQKNSAKINIKEQENKQEKINLIDNKLEETEHKNKKTKINIDEERKKLLNEAIQLKKKELFKIIKQILDIDLHNDYIYDYFMNDLKFKKTKNEKFNMDKMKIRLILEKKLGEKKMNLLSDIKEDDCKPIYNEHLVTLLNDIYILEKLYE